MNKRLHWVFVFILFVVLGMIPATAGAEKVVEYREHLYCSPGQPRVGIYPDLSYLIGSNLTKNDFVITYESTTDLVTLDENGNAMISPDAKLMHNLRIRITYTPKVAGVGEKTTFVVILRTVEPITEFKPTQDVLYMGMTTGNEWLNVTGVPKHEEYIVDVSYDPSIVSLEPYMYFGEIDKYSVTTEGVGYTEIVFTAYNGMRAITKVFVADRVSKMELASDEFTCTVGETIDLGLDLGNGEYGLLAYQLRTSLMKNGAEASWSAFFPKSNKDFYAKESGYYTVSYQTYSRDYQASAKINVYDRANCQRIELSSGELYLGLQGIQVICYDAQDNAVTLPLTLTAEEGVATLNGGFLHASGTGEVTITARNSNGTTISRTFTVVENPTEITLNKTELTLGIEETFDLEVMFDKGSYPHECTIAYEDANPPYELHCIRMEGDRIIAQAPGNATITVSSKGLTASCKVTVPKSEKELHMVLPPEPFGVGHTFQASVQDQTGKVYPAIFSTPHPESSTVEVRGDGLIIGRNEYAVGTVIAVLADGRVLKGDVEVKRIPAWLKTYDRVAKLSDVWVNLNWIESDVGDIYPSNLEITVEDPTICEAERGRLILHKAGATKVTLKSIYSDATTSFILEVIDDKKYIGSTNLDVPYGYAMALPVVTNAQGKEMKITWKITYDLPGEGNPEASGFVLEDNAIVCIWPWASCVVTGTAGDGSTVKVMVKGYLLPDYIELEPASIRVPLGKSKNVKIDFDKELFDVKYAYWAAETEGIVECKQVTNGVENQVYGKAVGKTLVLAALENGVFAICEVEVYDPDARYPGDANKDGYVTVYDAMMILDDDDRIDPANSNVNGDDTVDIQDALMLLQYSAGWGVSLK